VIKNILIFKKHLLTMIIIFNQIYFSLLKEIVFLNLKFIFNFKFLLLCSLLIFKIL